MSAALAPPSPAPGPPPLATLRAEAERMLGDWRDGRVERSYARFAEALRKTATAQQFAASLRPTKARFGTFVRIERAELGQGSRIGTQVVAVMESSVRFERGTAPVVFTFVEEGGAWRLRGLAVQDPAHPMPSLDERLVPGAARAIMDGAVRGGLGTVAARFPPQARDAPEDQMRATLDGQHRLLGPLRSYDLGTPSMNMIHCRDVVARAQFAEGEAAVTLTFCPLEGAWRIFEIDVAPQMSAPLFERLVAMAVADGLKRGDVVAKCPAGPVPVGARGRCRVTVAGRPHEVTVEHPKLGSVEVSGLE